MQPNTTTNNMTDEAVWLNAIAADEAGKIAEEIIQPAEDAVVVKSEVAVPQEAEKCPTKDGMEYEPMEAVVIPAGNVPAAPMAAEETEESEQSISFGEQMLIDRMDDLIAIMSDIRDRLNTTNGGDTVSSPQAVVPAEDAGSNLSSALLAALTITDGILATRK